MNHESLVFAATVWNENVRAGGRETMGLSTSEFQATPDTRGRVV